MSKKHEPRIVATETLANVAEPVNVRTVVTKPFSQMARQELTDAYHDRRDRVERLKLEMASIRDLMPSAR